jgi:hypothetical protein
MSQKRGTYLRGIISLSVLGLVVAGLLMAPAGAALPDSLKQLSNKLSNKRQFLNGSTVITEQGNVPGGFDEDAVAQHTTTCPPGTQLLGGGVTIPGLELPETGTFNSLQDVVVEESGPVVSGPGTTGFVTQWHVSLFNNGEFDETFFVTAICAKPAK